MRAVSSSEHIRFDLKHLRKTGKYSLEKLDTKQRLALERKLRDYEQHTERSFGRSKGAGLHAVNLEKWKNAPSEQQQRQVRKEVSVDVPNIGPVKRFRVSGKMRVLGYQDENVFFVVWVDPNHGMGG